MKRAGAVLRQWRYSLRWALPHRPCPGPVELASVVVEAGARCPTEISLMWAPGTGYGVCIDFLDDRPIRRWSEERKAAARRRNLARRLDKRAPLFAQELMERELLARPDSFAGKNPK